MILYNFRPLQIENGIQITQQSMLRGDVKAPEESTNNRLTSIGIHQLAIIITKYLNDAR
jgi:hypothetical protein